MSEWTLTCDITDLKAQLAAAIAERDALRAALELAHPVLFCADMFEKCAENQDEWSGPAQALFHAAKEYRAALDEAAKEPG